MSLQLEVAQLWAVGAIVKLVNIRSFTEFGLGVISIKIHKSLDI